MPQIELPWGAWYCDERHTLSLPDHWSVDVLAPRMAEPLTTDEINDALNAPLDSPPLQTLATGKNSACVAVDDLARPTRAADILPPLLQKLHAGGLDQSAITIVIATGSHRRLEPEQAAWKLGAEIAARYRWESHDCHASLAPTGIPYGNDELSINRTFFEAELKIVVGSVLPHSFAGYSGGAKMVLPGLADLRAIARSHKFVQLGLRGGSDPNQNRFRLEAEELARQLGLNFVVCAVTDQSRQTVSLSAGDVVAAHRHACSQAAEIFRTELSTDYDCVILNAFPKDTDLIQAENVFVALKGARAPVVREGGVIVLTTAASEGLGRHGLFEPGAPAFRSPARRRALGNRELWIYAPKLSSETIRQLYWDGYRTFADGAALEAALAERMSGPTRTGVLPCAPMQQIHDLRNTAEARV